MNRIDLDFFSKGIKCSAWLYLPEGVKKPPVVVMAHGITAQKDFGLQPYAEYFSEKGMAVFVFDYRNFGGSEGEPKNLVNPWRQINDWLAAISYVRNLDKVDGNRIAIWGTSFAGGHVIVVAAKEKGDQSGCFTGAFCRWDFNDHAFTHILYVQSAYAWILGFVQHGYR